MIALKKLYGEELLRLALMLSLLRADPERFLREDSGILAGGIVNGTDWAPEPGFRIIRPDHLHPKSLDSILLERERDVFEELQSLGRWGGPNAVRESVQAYLLSGVEGNVPPNIPQLQEPENDDNNYNYSTLENDDVEQCVTIKTEEDEELSNTEAVCNNNNLSFCKVENDSNDTYSDNAVASPSNVGVCGSPGFIKDLTAFRGPLLEDDSASAPWVKTEQEGKNFEDVINLSSFFNTDNAVDNSNTCVKEEASEIPFDGSSLLLQPVKKEDEEAKYFDSIDDNAVDDLIPSFYSMRPTLNGEYSIYDQNLADLKDYEETPASLEEFKKNIEEFDVGQASGESFERYLIENTDVEARLGVTNGSEASGGDGILRVFKSETDEDEGHCSGDELTEEDMDLIEVLWKQDVDMGFCLETPIATDPKCMILPAGEPLLMGGSPLSPRSLASTEKLLEEAMAQQSPQPQHEGKMRTDSGIEDPWAGLPYTVDTETGEYVLSGSERFDLLEEALQLVGLEDAEAAGLQADLKDPLLETASNHSDPASSLTAQKTSNEPDLRLLSLNDTSDSCSSDNSTMLAPRYPPLGHAHHHIGAVGSPGGPHHHHHHHHAGVHHLHHHSAQQAVAAHHHAAHAQHHFAAAYHHQNLVRSMSMEQRWQDLATLLALPAPAQPAGAGPPVAAGAISSLAGGQPPANMHHPGAQDPQHQNLYHNHHLNAVRGHLTQPTSAYVTPPYAPLSDKSPLAATADIYGAANLGSAVAASMNVAQPPPSSAAPPAPVPQPSPFYKSEMDHHQNGAGGIPPHVQQHHQDQMYYQQNSTSELNGTSDGFLSSILNDEDLQLMDMAMSEGMYTMRMLDSANNAPGTANNSNSASAILQHHQTHAGGHHNNNHHHHQPQQMLHHQANMQHGGNNNNNNGVLQMSTGMGSERVDASSDSAVSSMGSERVPSLSDSEWCDGGSDSAQDYHSKLRPCDGETRQTPLVAQKKHHMFGKRCFQEQSPLGRVRSGLSEQDQQSNLQLQSEVKFEYEQSPAAPTATYVPDVGHLTPEMKYSCTMEFSNGLPNVQNNGVAAPRHNHNHTYSLPPAPPQPPHRPLARDKLRGRRALEGAGSCGLGPLSRDEKRARALGIPMTVHDIINLPMDEFNERLSKHDLSESQLSLIRDIRRRGKNKVAAQNCRKRKLDQITSLADEVRDARTRKQRLQRDRQMLLAERQRAKEHFAALYRHVFQHLTDNDGNPLSSQQYSLQQAADGAVVLVPRASASLLPSVRTPRTVERHMSSNGTSDEEIERIKIKQRKTFDQ